ncbi:cell division protein FtsQ/DivIB [Carnobacterium sp.]|uniref:cell division protein FtsQ/DivIB n=1 Tax=Carnobacterium sp. TaxID=48221 RepID=UPI00388DE0C1
MRKQNNKKKPVTNLHLSSLKKGEHKKETADSDRQAAFQRKKSLEHTLPKLKKQRQKKLFTRLITLILLFSFAILIVVYFISPLSKVDIVSVSGAKEVADQEIIDESGIKSGGNLWEIFFERNKISGKVVSELPQVKSMEIVLDGLNDYTLEIEEYETVAYLVKDNEYYNILENGKIVNESRKVSIGNPPIFKEFEENKALKEMIVQYQSLNENIQNSISEVQYTPSKVDDYLIKLYMNDGNEVIASIPSFAEKMIYYPDMVKKVGDQKGTINIEVGAYFSPFKYSEDKNEESNGASDENGVELVPEEEAQ